MEDGVESGGLFKKITKAFLGGFKEKPSTPTTPASPTVSTEQSTQIGQATSVLEAQSNSALKTDAPEQPTQPVEAQNATPEVPPQVAQSDAIVQALKENPPQSQPSRGTPNKWE